MSTALTTKIDGRHVLAGLIVFFAVMLLANAIFVYAALTTFGGVDTEDAYRKGLAYNATLEEASRQATLGWETSLAYDESRSLLSLEISGQDGTLVTGLTITGRLLRPATSRFDRRLGVFEEQKGGLYVLHVTALDQGAWIADLTAQSSDHPPFHLRERLWLPPRS
jgi:nitrogen fixation protein FixH